MSRLLVTGGSAGIGFAAARLCAAAGDRVITLGTRPPRAGGELEGVLYRRFDLSRAVGVEGGAVDSRELINDFLGHEDASWAILLHCAGRGRVATLGTSPVDDTLSVLEVNLWAPIALTHYVAHRHSQAQTDTPVGHLYVSSLMATFPCTRFASYGASKRGLESFAWNLRRERLPGRRQVDRRVGSVAVLRPGSTRTEMQYRSGLRGPDEALHGASPEQVAKRVCRLLRRMRARPGRSPAPRTAGVVNALIRRLGAPVTALGRVRARGSLRRTAAFTGWEGKRVVVTGAASGIGRELLAGLRDAGAEVIGVDRAAPAEISVDLQDRGQVEALAREIGAAGGIDALVHSAGLSAVGQFADIPLRAHRQVFDVNLRAPVLLTELLLAHDRGDTSRGGIGAFRPGASIVFVSSLGVRVGYPGAAVYAATKAGLVGYAEGIRKECAAAQVHVSIVMPGPVRTAHARRYSPAGSPEERRTKPDTVAAAIQRGMEKRWGVTIPGVSARLFGLFGSAMPGLTALLLRRALLDRIKDPLLPPESQGSFKDQS